MTAPMFFPGDSSMWTVSDIQDKAEFMRFVLAAVPDDSVWVVAPAFAGKEAAEKELRPFALKPSQLSPLRSWWDRFWGMLRGDDDGICVPINQATMPRIMDMVSRGIHNALIMQRIYSGSWKDSAAYWLVSSDFLDCVQLSHRIPEPAMANASRTCEFKYEQVGSD